MGRRVEGVVLDHVGLLRDPQCLADFFGDGGSEYCQMVQDSIIRSKAHVEAAGRKGSLYRGAKRRATLHRGNSAPLPLFPKIF